MKFKVDTMEVIEPSVAPSESEEYIAPAPRVEPVRLSLPMIEVMPYRPGSRFARSDYHGLREHVRRPFLFLTTGRTETYHTAADTPDTVDYDRLRTLSRWVARLRRRPARQGQRPPRASVDRSTCAVCCARARRWRGRGRTEWSRQERMPRA